MTDATGGGTDMSGGVRVAVGHVATYAAPLAVARGEALVVSARQEIWDGHRWRWAVDPRGREGWIPDDLVVIDGAGTGFAARDYDAIELTCTAGEQLMVIETSHGWAWCRNGAGQRGWVPCRNLAN